MRSTRLFLLALALSAGGYALAQSGAFRTTDWPGPRAPLAPGEKRPVVIELFTSEGCSSCPPADALLIELERAQPVAGAEIIPLGFHVDYWDDLGWRDPFSSSEFTVRQQEYRLAFGNQTVYTPQVVIDGAREFLGSDRAQALRTIARAVETPKARLELSLTPAPPDEARRTARFAVKIAGLPEGAGEQVEIFLAITETGLASSVARGENAGRRLEHTAVVRRLERLARFASSSANGFAKEIAVKFDPAWRKENLRAVVFIQDRKSRRVLGATSLSLETHTEM